MQLGSTSSNVWGTIVGWVRRTLNEVSSLLRYCWSSGYLRRLSLQASIVTDKIMVGNILRKGDSSSERTSNSTICTLNCPFMVLDNMTLSKDKF